jgi:hypothetical protein
VIRSGCKHSDPGWKNSDPGEIYWIRNTAYYRYLLTAETDCIYKVRGNLHIYHAFIAETYPPNDMEGPELEVRILPRCHL